jgi:prepilin-type N-terminal cleavage/methylation domain-containing protein
MKGIYVNKKAFTMIEIILALVIASMASVYVIQTMMKQDFQEELIKFQDNLQYVIEEGIASPTGYASGAGSPCSPTLNYANLSTTNLFNCLRVGNSWSDLVLTSPTAFITNGTTSGFMNTYGGHDTATGLQNMGCGIQTIVDPSDNNKFNILVDCSRIAPLLVSNQDEDDKRRLAQVEDAIEFVMVRKLAYMYLSRDKELTRVDGTGSGNEQDGIVWGQFSH